MKKYWIPALIVLLSLNSISHAQFTLSGEFRPRAEYRDGYSTLKTENDIAALVLSQRTRLTADFQKDWLTTRFTFQNVRLWGNDNIVNTTGMFGNTGSSGLFEAWVEMTFLSNSSVRVGRQVWDYDDSRILSQRNWNNNGISYDALLYMYKRDGWEFDLGLSFNNTQNNLFGNEFPGDRLRTLNFARLNRSFNDAVSASFIAIHSGKVLANNPEIMYAKGTYGINMVYDKDGLDMFTNFYYQNGNEGIVEVSAWNFNTKWEYQLSDLRIRAGLSMISGNDESNGKYNMFDLLYGVRHRDYGHMDYFNNMPAATRLGGLNNYFAGLSYRLTQRTSLLLDYHYFTLNQAVADPRPQPTVVFMDKPLGSEIDLAFSTNFGNGVNLRGGYGIMLPTETLQILNTRSTSSETSQWVWLMLTVKPVFFTTK